MSAIKEFHGFWMPATEQHMLNYATEPGWTYQKHKLDATMKYVKQRRVCIDVGGHCGTWSTHFTKLFDHIYAFEPMKMYRKCFVKNVDMKNVTLYPYALGEKQGKVTMRANDLSSGDTYVSTGDEGQWKDLTFQEAEMRTIDEYGFEDVDLIKIDCEGYEYFVIKGAMKTITKNRPVIVVEQKHTFATKYNLHPQEAVFYLQKQGYKQEEVIAGDYIMTP